MENPSRLVWLLLLIPFLGLLAVVLDIARLPIRAIRGSAASAAAR
jgi:hypothetical protein